MASESDPKPGPPTPDELRGKDLVALPREQAEAALDPATMAELASWFDRPSAVIAAEEAEAREAEAREAEEADKRHARIAADADPALLAMLERHNAVPDQLIRPRPPARLHLDETIVPTHVRAALDGFGEDAPADTRELEQPADIADAVAQGNAPQAILRDLYRPVPEYDRRLEAAFDPDEAAPMYQVGAVMVPREPIPWIGRALDALAGARDEFRAITQVPWDQHGAAVAEARKRAEEPES